MCARVRRPFTNYITSMYLYPSRQDVSITVTSISSRERPRARGPGGGASHVTSKGHSRASSNGQEYATRPTPTTHRVRRASPPRHTASSPYLNTPSSLYRNSRSLESGLDDFGAVPFSSSPQTTRAGHVPQTHINVAQVMTATVCCTCTSV